MDRLPANGVLFGALYLDITLGLEAHAGLGGTDAYVTALRQALEPARAPGSPRDLDIVASLVLQQLDAKYGAPEAPEPATETPRESAGPTAITDTERPEPPLSSSAPIDEGFIVLNGLTPRR